MTTRRFFSLVWRVNAVVIFAVGIGALCVLLFAASMLYKDMMRTRHGDDIANRLEAADDVAKTDLGDFAAVGGAAILRAPLHRLQEYSSSKGAISIQNYPRFLS